MEGPIHRKALAKAEAQRQRDLQLGASKGAAESALVCRSALENHREMHASGIMLGCTCGVWASQGLTQGVSLLACRRAAAPAMFGICDAHRCPQAAAAWANGGVLSGRRQPSQARPARPAAQDADMVPQQSSQGGMYANRGSTGVAGRLGGRQQGPGRIVHMAHGRGSTRL